jgi:hypothetical protein
VRRHTSGAALGAILASIYRFSEDAYPPPGQDDRSGWRELA